MNRKLLVTAATYGVLALGGVMSISLPDSLPIAGAMPKNAVDTTVQKKSSGALEPGDEARELSIGAKEFASGDASVEMDRCRSVCRGWGSCTGRVLAGDTNGAVQPQVSVNPADE